MSRTRLSDRVLKEAGITNSTPTWATTPTLSGPRKDSRTETFSSHQDGRGSHAGLHNPSLTCNSSSPILASFGCNGPQPDLLGHQAKADRESALDELYVRNDPAGFLHSALRLEFQGRAVRPVYQPFQMRPCEGSPTGF